MRNLRAVGPAAEKPRVGRYIRVSRVMGRRDEKFLSPTLQDEALTRQIDARFGPDGFTDAGTFVDLDVSGGTMVRRSLSEALDLARQGRLDYLAVYELTRWSRDTEGGLAALRDIDAIGCRLLNAGKDVDLSDPDDEFSVSIELVIATRQRKKIGQQWRAVHANRTARGLPSSMGPRFGYVVREGRYEPDPATGPVLADLYRRYVVGEGMLALARWCNSHGITTTTGGPFTASGMARMLDSGFAAGLLRHRDGTFTPGVQPRLVDEKGWKAYLAARRKAHRTPPRVRVPTYMLAGLVRCECGASCHTTSTASGRGYLYVCSAWKNARTCPGVWITRARVEAEVMTWLADLPITVPDVQAHVRTQAAEQKAAARQTARQITDLERQQKRLTRLLGQDTLRRWEYDTAMAEIDTEIHALRDRLRLLEEPVPANPLVVARTLLARWEALDVQGRRDALATLIREVTVTRSPERCTKGSTVRIIPTWT